MTELWNDYVTNDEVEGEWLYRTNIEMKCVRPLFVKL